MMEHRLDRRVPLAIPVRLRLKDGTCALGVAMNIGQGGLFVKTPLCPGANLCVEVQMTLSMNEGERSVVLPALTMHRSSGGIGLMFRTLDEAAEEVVDFLLDSGCRTARNAAGPAPRH